MSVYIPVYKLKEEDILSIFYKLPPIVYHNNKYCYEFGNGTLTDRILTTWRLGMNIRKVVDWIKVVAFTVCFGVVLYILMVLMLAL